MESIKAFNVIAPSKELSKAPSKKSFRSASSASEVRFMDSAGIPNAFTVDVEDYFQVAAFERRITRSEWARYEPRVEANTDRLLSVMDRHSVRGTFFVLGWIAWQFPKLVKRIHAAGHEIASHGFWHRLVYGQTREDFVKDICDSRAAIADACGVVVKAYRAPCFSIIEKSMWAIDALIENGFEVDSSIFPIRGHDRYGVAGARMDVHRIETPTGRLTEFPPSVWSFGPLPVPIGGGYFRILPTRLSMKGIEMIRRAGRPAMFYIHPWEIDPDQPRIANVGMASYLRHYSGLKSTEYRLQQLFRSHSFDTMSNVLSAVDRVEVAEKNLGSDFSVRGVSV